jgi:penicillin-binding protein 1A
MRKILKFLAYSLLLLGIVVATFLATLFLGGFGKIPTKSELVALQNEAASLVLASNGDPIGKFFKENRTNVPYDSLPSHLVEALIATEDARFYDHDGVDARALFRVLFKTVLLGNRSSGGGSTLSQQLAKNLFGRKDYGKISLGVNKLKEIVLANRLEEVYSKQEIIQLYFNTVPFSENIYGIEVAAQRFFSVPVSELKVEQAAVLVGMLKANTRYNPRLNPINAKERRNVVFTQMQVNGYLNQQQLDSLSAMNLELHYTNLSLNALAPYFMEELQTELKAILQQVELKTGKAYNYQIDGLRITSTLNKNVQQAGKAAFKQHLGKMQRYFDQLYAQGRSRRNILKLAQKIAKREQLDLTDETVAARNLFTWENPDSSMEVSIQDSLVHTLKQLHAGLLGINPQNGAILTWIGGIDFSSYPYDQVLAKRQLASTFKPILYAEALRSGRKPCDYISNESIVLNDYDNWSPQNYDGSSGGSYSLAAALANSKNLPTVHLYFETEQERLKQLWNDLGFIDPLNEGPSVILGTNSVSLLELALAYSVFANGGQLVDSYTIQRIVDAEGVEIYTKKPKEFPHVLEKGVTTQLNQILQKAIQEGTGASIRSKYGLRFPLAGKTGTSQDFADAWFVAYNPNLLLVSRVGASYPNIHFNSGTYGSGGRLALPLVALCLQEAQKDAEFKRRMNAAYFGFVASLDCDDYKDADLIDKVFKFFKRKEMSLEDEREKAKKKKKVKGFFKSIFGEKE